MVVVDIMRLIPLILGDIAEIRASPAGLSKLGFSRLIISNVDILLYRGTYHI